MFASRNLFEILHFIQWLPFNKQNAELNFSATHNFSIVFVDSSIVTSGKFITQVDRKHPQKIYVGGATTHKLWSIFGSSVHEHQHQTVRIIHDRVYVYVFGQKPVDLHNITSFSLRAWILNLDFLFHNSYRGNSWIIGIQCFIWMTNTSHSEVFIFYVSLVIPLRARFRPWHQKWHEYLRNFAPGSILWANVNKVGRTRVHFNLWETETWHKKDSPFKKRFFGTKIMMN